MPLLDLAHYLEPVDFGPFLDRNCRLHSRLCRSNVGRCYSNFPGNQYRLRGFMSRSFRSFGGSLRCIYFCLRCLHCCSV